LTLGTLSIGVKSFEASDYDSSSYGKSTCFQGVEDKSTSFVKQMINLPVTYPQGWWTEKGGSIQVTYDTATDDVTATLPLSNFPAVYLKYFYTIKGETTGTIYAAGSDIAVLGQGNGLKIVKSFSGIKKADKNIYIEAQWTDASVSEQPYVTGKAIVDTSLLP